MNAHNNRLTGDCLLLEFNLASVIGVLALSLDTEDCVRSNLNTRRRREARLQQRYDTFLLEQQLSAPRGLAVY